MNTLEVLEKARALIADEPGWTVPQAFSIVLGVEADRVRSAFLGQCEPLRMSAQEAFNAAWDRSDQLGSLDRAIAAARERGTA